MPNDDDSNAGPEASIHDRVRKDPQRKYSATFRGWCAEARMIDQELSDALELGEESLRHE